MQYGKVIDTTIVLSLIAVCVVSLEALITSVIADRNVALFLLVGTGVGVLVIGMDRLAEIWEEVEQ
jgi:hypothetical protein